MPALIVREKKATDNPAWDHYVRSRPDACVYHLSGWQEVIEQTYGHRTYYLMATLGHGGAVVGVLPLVHLRSLFFGNHLVSIPFFDSAGLLYDHAEAGAALMAEMWKLADHLAVRSVELRQRRPLEDILQRLHSHGRQQWTMREKARLVLELPATANELMRGFKSKLRSQIKNSIKKGLKIRIGGHELLNDFYRVFSVNMRDLGSPVHSIRLMARVLDTFPDETRIMVVHQNGSPLACSMVVVFGKLLANPWASSLRRYSSLNPNMLLYWSMLEYACGLGLKCFDFGRSSPDAGSYKFKQQWGASPEPILWYDISATKHPTGWTTPDRRRYEFMTAVWQRLPVSITRIIGPMIRKRISL